MILTALVDYYEQLLREQAEGVAQLGWGNCEVKYQLAITEDGVLRSVIPLGDKRGVTKRVPERVKRTAGVAANVLCDTPPYLLGYDTKGKPDRAAACFAASRERHHRVFDGIDAPAARAVLAFFDAWDPAQAGDNPLLTAERDGLLTDGNLAFVVVQPDGTLIDPLEDAAVRSAWDASCSETAGASDTMVCLVTGKRSTIAQLHPPIKGVIGAQATGASLVSFNAPAFESYGHDNEQGRNAPVSTRAAQAYGIALNYLIAHPGHHLRLGDTTVVFWSEHTDQASSELFSMLLGGMASSADGMSGEEVDRAVGATLTHIAQGQDADVEGIDVHATFYVLGLAPNAARLAVRFFMRSEFGAMLRNIRAHYARTAVVHAPFERAFLSPYWLLRAVENENSKNPVVSSELSGPLVRAILEGGRYPESLYANCLLRIRATRDVTYARAAIIRAYLIRNCGRTEDDVTEQLNPRRTDTAYALGRTFSLLGQIQENANGKDTLTQRYLDSACSTPAVVFPTLLKLANAHLAKVGRNKPGLASFFDSTLDGILAGIDAFPTRLSLIEQGDFMLGYYHQKAARYQKAETAAADTDENPAADNQED